MKKTFKIITLFPELIESYLQDALLSKAIQQNLIEVQVINLRNFSDNSYKSVDEKPYGGGDGMLLRADILEAALKTILNSEKKQKVIYLSPQGGKLNQQQVKTFAQDQHEEFILICGRYAGVDARFIEKYVDQETSIGDFVLSGGELPALVFLEAVSRFIPNVLGKLESAEKDSFSNNLLEAPQYTKPQTWNDLKVPDVLLSGHHENISKWKAAMEVQVTLEKRPDLLAVENLSADQKKLIEGLKKYES